MPVPVTSRADLTAALSRVRATDGRIALVPTMGALHDGHATLIRAARSAVGDDDAVVVSIFVNPLQFAAGEDLATYPRTLDADLEVCAAAGADVVFVPSVSEVYPGGDPTVTVDPGPDRRGLEGTVRPGHFRGVATVVAKLFGLVRPDLALFGEKDYEQLALIRQMVSDLCMAVEIIGVPTVREPDGLAMSSRNLNLTPADRVSARCLSRALRAGAEAGARGGDAVLAAAEAVLAAEPSARVDYLALRAPDLTEAPAVGPARLLVAARLGATRLIDNVGLVLAGPTDSSGAP